MSGHRRNVSFIASALPAPDERRARRTTAASAVIALFLTVTAYLSLSCDSASSAHVSRWVFSRPALGVGPQSWPQGVQPALIDDDGTGVSTSAHAPDFHRFRWHADLPFDPVSARGGRLIVIGDVHGMIKPLQTLLAELAFDATADTVVFVGDLVAKAPRVEDSIAVVTLARSIGALAVKGNHDDKTVAFRLWQDWNSDGASRQWLEADKEPSALREKLPHGYNWRSQHFQIAQGLSQRDFQWLLNRPLSLHIRSMHTYIVHAGLLPEAVTNGSEKLGTGGEEELESMSPYEFEPTPEALSRMTADGAVLLRRQNRRPATLIEMRGVSDNGTHPHADGKRGVPWPVLWKDAMEECSRSITCRPLSIIYGHWAKRGLQIDPFSIGLDSGCVYGRSLSAVVIESDGYAATLPANSLRSQIVTFAGRKGTVYSLQCDAP